MLRAISKEITVLYGILQCIDINDFVIDRSKEKRRIKCIMVDEYDNYKGRSILVMGSI
jgi:hypothetical protein